MGIVVSFYPMRLVTASLLIVDVWHGLYHCVTGCPYSGAREQNVAHMNVRDLGRLRDIAAVLVRNGFGYLIQGTSIDVGGEAPESRLSPAARLRQVLVELGPTFVKLGQVMSVRPDILPGPFIRELESLQNNVDPVDFDTLKNSSGDGMGNALGRPAAVD